MGAKENMNSNSNGIASIIHYSVQGVVAGLQLDADSWERLYFRRHVMRLEIEESIIEIINRHSAPR